MESSVDMAGGTVTVRVRGEPSGASITVVTMTGMVSRSLSVALGAGSEGRSVLSDNDVEEEPAVAF
jgi:hypothetical protein